MGKIDSSLKKLRKEEIRKVFEQRHSLTWKASTKFPKIPNGNLNILCIGTGYKVYIMFYNVQVLF
jgi:hypothetical protein